MRINIAELTAAIEDVSMLDALELREQAGMSVGQVGETIKRIVEDKDPDFDLLGDVDVMKSLTAALWIAARVTGETPGFREFMNGIKLRELGEAGTALATAADIPIPDRV